MVKCIHGNVYPSECCRLRRDHFAAAALAGLLSLSDDEDLPIEPNQGETVAQYLARAAVDYANALIAELDKPQE